MVAHAPVAGLQHAPGQELGLQVPPLTQRLGAGQLTWAVMVHPPDWMLQHAPEHGLGTQTPPAGPHVPPRLRQLDCVVMPQTLTPAALTRQHGPTGGHGFGLQTEKGESGRKPVGQLVVVVVHAPVVGLQQTTGGGGQGLGLQVWPTNT